MAHVTLEQMPVRVRDVSAGGRLLIGVIGGVLTFAALLFSMGAWKGGVDDQIKGLGDKVDTLQRQMDHMDGKIDRLTETVEIRKR